MKTKPLKNIGRNELNIFTKVLLVACYLGISILEWYIFRFEVLYTLNLHFNTFQGEILYVLLNYIYWIVVVLCRIRFLDRKEMINYFLVAKCIEIKLLFQCIYNKDSYSV